MKIEPFGKALIETGDLDPVYIALWGAKLPKAQLARLLLAYWCFYHLGSAAWLSEHSGVAYWNWMLQAATNKLGPPNIAERWPRGAERRYFRGDKCINSVRYFAGRCVPELLLEGLAKQHYLDDVMETVETWPMFSKWSAFKIADMLERVWGSTVQIDANVVLLYDQPRNSLEHLASLAGVSVETRYQQLLSYFGAYKAPPTFDRVCGPAEVETIVCKMGSYLGGHYKVGKDIREMRHALRGWGDTADKLLVASPKEVPVGLWRIQNCLFG